MVPVGRSMIRLPQSFFLVFLYMFCTVNHSIGSDTISVGQSLFVNQTVVSKGGTFELGFFSPGKSSNFYIGIWYKNISILTVVWVANRESPIPLDSHYNSSLLISNGNLILCNDLRTVIWTTSSIIRTLNATEAILLDTGNLVLRDGLGVEVWQSFDYPTDTWLPGGTVGLDKITKRKVVLTSWKNSQEPTPGMYSFGMDPSGSPELLTLGIGEKREWRSGFWNGWNFTSAPEMGINSMYNFSYVSNENKNYFTYKAFNMTRVVIESSGEMKLLKWSERDNGWLELLKRPRHLPTGEAHGRCGPFGMCELIGSPYCSCLPGFEPRSPKDWQSFDYSGGCLRKFPLQCRTGKLAFFKMSNIKLTAYSRSLVVRKAQICRQNCLVDCSCNAYSYTSSGRCLLWTGDLLDVQTLNDTSGEDIYLKLNAFEVSDKGNKKKLHKAIPVFVTLPILMCGSILCGLWRWRRKLKQKEDGKIYQNLLLLNLDISTEENTSSITRGNKMIGEKVPDLPMFSFSSISAATNNFSAANKLGEGGFGPVYKGSLLNGQLVAVKRLSQRSGQGLEELRNETILIAKLQHRNLVRLLGCCIEQDEKILIYEYMPNKSLDSFLFDPNKRKLLNWRKSVQIIEGIAQGLLYLHHYSRLRIIHRDLKASNVLLDGDMNPKISDFGLARIFEGNELQANTNRIVGTYGYMSPEYAMEGRFSIKSDVFAFGVMLLEILSGKKNTGFHHLDCLSLLEYAWNLWENDRVLELMDPILEIPSASSTPLRYITVGLLCVQESPADRPTISDVVAMFSNEHTRLLLPKRPAFTAGPTLLYASSGKVNDENCSINDLTNSVMEAR